MNCREFLIEFEDRGTLSEPALLHLTICADCKKMSERQTRIWNAIDKFARVNAPNDFDFRVKARIANARPADFQPRFLPVLRYILPVAVIVALAGLIAFNTSYFSRGNANDVAIAEETKPKVIEGTSNAFDYPAQSTPFTSSKSEPSAAETPQEITPRLIDRVPQNETAQTLPKERRKSRQTKNEDEGIGSLDSGITGTKSRIPKGFEINPIPNLDGETRILEFNGIKTAIENGKRTVKSILQNSPAARLGIKVGDVIEKVAGNSIFVLRGAEQIEIKLQTSIGQP